MTPHPPATSSERAQHLRTALADWPRQRVPLDQLWRLLDTIDPATRTYLHRRQLLADTLDELAAAQAIRLPSRNSYDRTERPPLPLFVTLPKPSSIPQPKNKIVWHPTLSWAADATLAPGHRPVLEKINRWLFHNRSDRVVPLRERSLEILGDEKALDRLQTNSLFGPGRLTLDLIRARRVAPPMHTVQVGDGPILLVVENSDTFDSLRTVLTHVPGKVGNVGWGAGGAFEASVLSIAAIRHDVRDVAYFGDLDAKGLQVPANADRLASAFGLPHVRPAAGLYTALRDTGHHQTGPMPVDTTTAATLASWLPSQHHAWAAELLTSGTRVAQEAVGLTYLTEHDDWRTDLR
jgi:Wadjet anti plasmid transformation system JetA-like protein